MPRLEGHKSPVTRTMVIVLVLLILALGAFLLYDQYQQRSVLEDETIAVPAQTSAGHAPLADAAWQLSSKE
ncbi:hypothetical protein [Thermithiobacillus plumbiphilus]|uniref:Uncharacterized protein n=1 Tax=Thermithiobacillus plumbiphilus TaxID=1729899 RepID=A0ABU9D804_9PROT